MTQSFDDFYEENKDVFDPCIWRSAEKVFKAGAQSKQAEIDELWKRNEQAIAYIQHWYGCVELSNIVDILNGEMKWENNQ